MLTAFAGCQKNKLGARHNSHKLHSSVHFSDAHNQPPIMAWIKLKLSSDHKIMSKIPQEVLTELRQALDHKLKQKHVNQEEFFCVTGNARARLHISSCYCTLLVKVQLRFWTAYCSCIVIQNLGNFLHIRSIYRIKKITWLSNKQLTSKDHPSLH